MNRMLVAQQAHCICAIGLMNIADQHL